MRSLTKLFIISVGLLLSLSLNAQESIVGKWTIIDKGDTGYFEFDKEGFATMFFDGKKFGGKRFLMSKTPACVKYSFDKVENLFHLNLYIISLTNNDSNIITIAPGILKTIDKNSYLFNINMEHNKFGGLTKNEIAALRPKDFTDTENTVTLMRVK